MSEIDELKFEEAFKELELAVEALEEEELSLEEAIMLYERGQSLLAHCQAQLSAAELKVEELSPGSSNGLAGEGV